MVDSLTEAERARLGELTKAMNTLTEEEADRLKQITESMKDAPEPTTESEVALARAMAGGDDIDRGEGEEVVGESKVKDTLKTRGKTIYINEDSTVDIEDWRGGKLRGLRRLKHGDDVHVHPLSNYGKRHPDDVGKWYWDDNEKTLVRVAPTSTAVVRPAAPTLGHAERLPGESEKDFLTRRKREIAAALERELAGASATTTTDTTAGGDDASKVLSEAEMVKENRALLRLMRKKKIEDPKARGQFFSDIRAADTQGKFDAIRLALNDLDDREVKPKPNPTDSAADLAAAEKRRQDVLAGNVLPAQMSDEELDAFLKTRGRGGGSGNGDGGDATAANAAAADAAYQAELAAWNQRSPVRRWWDRVMDNNRPPRAPEVASMLRPDSEYSEREKNIIRTVERATREQAGIIERDAVSRGETDRFNRISNFKGAGKGILIGATAITVFGLLTGGLGGVAAAALIPKLLGMGAGVLASTYVRNANDKAGRTGFASKFLLPFVIGTIAGVGTGALTANIWEGISSWFTGDAPSSKGGVPINTDGNNTRPPYFDTLESAKICGKESVWSQLVGDLYDIKMLDNWGRDTFANAFHRTIDTGGWQGELLSLNGEPLHGVNWKLLPDGTIANFESLFAEPGFQENLCKVITKSYPSLAQQIGESGISVKEFVRNVGMAYGVR